MGSSRKNPKWSKKSARERKLLSREKRLNLAVDWLKNRDKSTELLISRVGKCNFYPLGTSLYILTKSVIGQQLSTKAAQTIEDRFFRLLGCNAKNLHWKHLSSRTLEDFRSIGMSLSKAETILRIADAFHSGDLSETSLKKLQDTEVIQLLTQYKGIGPWTAEMVLIFALDRWDHFSIRDLILRKQIEKWYGIQRDNVNTMKEHLTRYSPYRTILSWYLWASADGESGGGWA